MKTLANITIPSPRQPLVREVGADGSDGSDVEPVAVIVRRRLIASTSTSELRRRLVERNGQ